LCPPVRTFRSVCALLLLLSPLLLFGPAFAQTGNQGSLEGLVTDPSSAVIAGAILRATDQQRGLVFTALTNDEGLFRFPALPVGTYELDVEHPGFAKWVDKNVNVTIGAQINLSITLRVAGTSEAFVVSDAPPAVETTRSQFSSTVASNLISNLPANGRNYLDFVLLTPGVTRGSRGSFDLSFAGQRKMNLLRVDGADNDNTWFGEALGLSGSGFAPYQFSMATVEEFQVNTNAYSATLGRAGVAVINVVTKSGTNDLHGSAFWYYRDRSLNANDLVNKLSGQPKSPYHFNQFGGTLGGPVRRDRVFLFLAYDGQRSTAENLVRLNLPPGFHLSADPTTAAFQQRALDYLNPRATSWLRTFDQNIGFVKLDWRINPQHLLNGRWNGQRFTGGNLGDIGPQSPGQQGSLEHTGNSLSATDTLSISLTSSVSRSIVNSLLFAYVRSQEPGFANSPNPEANIFEGGQLVLTVGRRSVSPLEQDIDRLQTSDTVSIQHGRHLIQFGGEVLPNWITFFQTANFSGSFRFPSLGSFGRSLAAAPPSSPDLRQYTQAFSGDGSHGTSGSPDFVDYAGFVQDEWRLHPQLTLNLGVRYDLEAISKPVVRNPSPALASAGLDTSELRTDKNNFAPRLGLAWAPLHNGSLVFRAGYGLYYARTPSVLTGRAYSQNGITVQTRTLFGGTADASSIPSYPNNMCGPPDLSGAPPNCAAPPLGGAGPLLQFFSPAYVQPYTQQGSLGFQVQLAQDWVLSASYLGVKGSHLQRWQDGNLGTPESPASIGIAGTTESLSYQRFTLPRPIAGFGRILLLESSASSIYHALVLQIQRRYAHGFQLSGSYTLSKTIDDNPEPAAFNPPTTDNLLLSDATNPRADRSLGADDQRHRFVLSGVWEIRGERLHASSARMFLTGWELSGIFTAQNGLPYSGYVSGDLNNDGNTNNDRTPGLGRNTFRPPPSVSLDPRLTWNLPLTERVRLQTLAETFNVLNHGNITTVRTTQFGVSTSLFVCGIAKTPCLVPQNAGLVAFGAPTATSGPRIIQLSMKLLF
jgi:outer membrane receptor protein involved in Fe transport